MLLGGVRGMLLNGVQPFRAEKSLTLNVNNTTGSITGFAVTGAVWVLALWGQVKTAFSSAVTAAHFRTNDQTATIDLSEAVTGLTMSSFGVGSMCLRTGQVDVALSGMNVSAGRVVDGGNDWLGLFTPFSVLKKTAAVTTIDFRYATTNAPSSGVLLQTALWLPMSDDGFLA